MNQVQLGLCYFVFLIVSSEAQLFSRFSPKFGYFSEAERSVSECVNGLWGCDQEPSVCREGEFCKPAVSCSSQISNLEDVRSCVQVGGNPGVCCRDINQAGIESNVLPESKVDFVQSDAYPQGRSLDGLNERSILDQIALAINAGQKFVVDAITFAMGINQDVPVVDPASISHFETNRPIESEIKEQAINATINMWASKQLTEQNLVRAMPSSGEDPFGVSQLIRAAVSTCPPNPTCNFQSKYRTLDGSCNSAKEPKFGMAGTPLQRVQPNAYGDGFFLPRSGTGGSALPLARVASLQIVQFVSTPQDFNNLMTAFGQFFIHDIASVPIADDGSGRPPNCCAMNLGTQASSLICLPIFIPFNDPVMGGKRSCMNFVRSLSAVRIDCQIGPQEQMNQVTHWIDASPVYGLNPGQNSGLRAGVRGLLSFELEADGGMLPPTGSGRCGPQIGKCFKTGDVRSNQQPLLALVHVLFLREHNRVAMVLSTLNPHWNDETVFQEARRIVIAEFQHILYNEWLPIIMGPKLMQSLNLSPLTNGFLTKYNPDINPSVVNAFIAAAGRQHTLLSSIIRKSNPATGQEIRRHQLDTTFGDMDILRGSGQVAALTRGAISQSAEGEDNNFVNDMINNLFGRAPNGLDIFSIHIQRGRDHGLPGYVKYRELCSKVKVKTFEDLRSNMEESNIITLRNLYKTVDDIDLFVGGTLEKPFIDGALMGNTFLCLFADQLLRLKLGDKHFYENGQQPGSFKLGQLNEIRKTSIARLICDNVPEIKIIQPLAFLNPDVKRNPVVSCANSIEKVDLAYWKEG